MSMSFLCLRLLIIKIKRSLTLRKGGKELKSNELLKSLLENHGLKSEICGLL